MDPREPRRPKTGPRAPKDDSKRAKKANPNRKTKAEPNQEDPKTVLNRPQARTPGFHVAPKGRKKDVQIAANIWDLQTNRRSVYSKKFDTMRNNHTKIANHKGTEGRIGGLADRTLSSTSPPRVKKKAPQTGRGAQSDTKFD